MGRSHHFTSQNTIIAHRTQRRELVFPEVYPVVNCVVAALIKKTTNANFSSTVHAALWHFMTQCLSLKSVRYTLSY